MSGYDNSPATKASSRAVIFWLRGQDFSLYTHQAQAVGQKASPLMNVDIT